MRQGPLRALHSGQEPDPRFSLANERTLLAWIRTSLGLVAAGLAVYAFGDDAVPPHLLAPAALVLLAAGAVVAVAALQRWHAVQVALRHDEPLPLPHLAFPLVGLILVAIACGVALVAG